jgi:hypothetical protein
MDEPKPSAVSMRLVWWIIGALWAVCMAAGLGFSNSLSARLSKIEDYQREVFPRVMKELVHEHEKHPHVGSIHREEINVLSARTERFEKKLDQGLQRLEAKLDRGLLSIGEKLDQAIERLTK